MSPVLATLLEFGPAAFFYLLAMAAQVSGYNSPMLGIILAGLGTVWLCASIIHRWHKGRIGVGKTGVEPSHLIVFGLVGAAFCMMVAAAGFIWQQWQAPVHAASTGNRETAASQPLKRMYTAYDIEERLKAIDAFDTVLAKLYPIDSKAQALVREIDREIRDGTAPDSLLKLANEANVIFTELGRLDQQYSDRFQDIVRTAFISPNNYHPASLYSASINLRAELFKWAGRADVLPYIQNNQYMVEWQRTISGMQSFLAERRSKLAEKRREYESADVYPSK